jgi:hypothetical protein
LILLRLYEEPHGLEQGSIHGKDLTIEKITGLACALGGVQLVEAFHFVFHGVELDQAWLDLLDARRIRTEIVMAA